jgi:SAM-dependent methyltransferase
VNAAAYSPGVVWHDVECGAYAADLPLWRELAGAAPGPVLEIGAGTGRVALDLARAGSAVTALDSDGELLAELAARAAAEGLRVATAQADAHAFDLGTRFGLIAAPMQVVQLLGDRPAFLATARRHLAAGGLVAIAFADELEAFEPEEGRAGLPEPDLGKRDGWRFVSQPVAVRDLGDRVRIERVRVALAPDGTRERSDDAIELARVDGALLAAEGRAAGLQPEPSRQIDATDEHIGTEVVMLRG